MYSYQPYVCKHVRMIIGNVALAGTQGGPEKYDMYLRYGAPPTVAKWDWKAEVLMNLPSPNGQTIFYKS
jgi:hypothetical protein